LLLREVAYYAGARGPVDQLEALLVAVTAVGFLAVATRGLHLDGLADTADGLAIRNDRPRALEVMRQSDIGPFGVTALVLMLLFQISTLAIAVMRGHGSVTIVTAVVAGRVAAVWCCHYQAARPEGLGAWVAHTVSVRAAVLVTVVSLVVPALFLLRDDDPRVRVIPFAIVAIPIAIAGVLLLQVWWRRRFGGMTGDTIGASLEIATAIALFVLAIAPA